MGLDQNKWGLKFMTTNNQTSIASLAKKRRTYSAEFKIVQACKAPDVSIASVALKHGLNTNLVSKWIRLIGHCCK